MSDTEMDETTPRASDEVDLNKSLQEVLKSAARNDGLARGLRGKHDELSSSLFLSQRISMSV